jgi:hypothetical protein
MMQKTAFAAAAIFRSHLTLILICALCVSLPGLYGEIFTYPELNEKLLILITSFVQELLSTAFFIFIFYRIRKQDPSHPPFSLHAILLTTAFYQFAWLINHLPLLLTFLLKTDQDVYERLSSMAGMSSLFISFSILFWASRYYFIFWPLLIEGKSLKDSFKATSLQSEHLNRRAALQVVATALVMSAIVTQCAVTFYPQPEHPMVKIFGDLADGIYWIVMTCLCIGFTRVFEKNISDSFSITKNNQLLANIFGAKGLGKAIVCLLLLSGWQLYRLTAAEPTATFKTSISSFNETTGFLTVHLDAVDEKNHFSNFQPLFLRIAGEDGFILSDSSELISPSRYPEEILKAPVSLQMTIRFRISNRREDFVQLKDVYLWYGTHRLSPLDLSNVPIETTPEVNQDAGQKKAPFEGSLSSKTMSLAGAPSNILDITKLVL